MLHKPLVRKHYLGSCFHSHVLLSNVVTLFLNVPLEKSKYNIHGPVGVLLMTLDHAECPFNGFGDNVK